LFRLQPPSLTLEGSDVLPPSTPEGSDVLPLSAPEDSDVLPRPLISLKSIDAMALKMP
jgi:hypothetical protein